MPKMIDPRSKVKRRGRPPVYTPTQRRTVAKYMRRLGLTHGLAECEVKEGFTVSVPTALKIAKDKGIVFVRGRRPVNV